MSQDPAFTYSGTDNLEAMTLAENYNAYLVDLVAGMLKPGMTVVDFGAGIGTFAQALSRRGHRVLCIEPDPSQAAQIRTNGLEVFASIEDLPDASVDAVYTLNVLEHIDDDVSALRSIHAKLRPGGRFLSYVPAFNLLYSDMDRLVGHVRRYRVPELAGKVKTAGFSVTQARYADSLGFLAALAYRMIDRSGGRLNPKSVATYDRFIFPVSCLFDRLGLSRLFGKNVLVCGRA